MRGAVERAEPTRPISPKFATEERTQLKDAMSSVFGSIQDADEQHIFKARELKKKILSQISPLPEAKTKNPTSFDEFALSKSNNKREKENLDDVQPANFRAKPLNSRILKE